MTRMLMKKIFDIDKKKTIFFFFPTCCPGGGGGGGGCAASMELGRSFPQNFGQRTTVTETKTMAREKLKKIKGQPKKMLAMMTVRKGKPPVPKYLVCVWWTTPADYIIKTRLNPEYRA